MSNTQKLNPTTVSPNLDPNSVLCRLDRLMNDSIDACPVYMENFDAASNEDPLIPALITKLNPACENGPKAVCYHLKHKKRKVVPTLIDKDPIWHPKHNPTFVHNGIKEMRPTGWVQKTYGPTDTSGVEYYVCNSPDYDKKLAEVVNKRYFKPNPIYVYNTSTPNLCPPPETPPCLYPNPNMPQQHCSCSPPKPPCPCCSQRKQQENVQPIPSSPCFQNW